MLKMKITLGGLALVCLVNLACSAPVDSFGEKALKILEALETLKRGQDDEWHYYEAINSMEKAEQDGDLTFNEGKLLLLKLGNKNKEEKWVTGCYDIPGWNTYMCGWVPTGYFKLTPDSNNAYPKPEPAIYAQRR
ncbi:unnamed protein product [Owenia fusiformis]|uniref:Uncharacterized protein n=1 Tax=Owenia fusiformis TaxID=6347 RepID=A0A8J1XLH8_OWEFU|nr:unnamed protein product [Owenia fusiformis]